MQMKSFDQFKNFMDVLKVENDAIGPLKQDLLKQLNLDFVEEFKKLSPQGQWQILKEFILWMKSNFKNSEIMNQNFSEVGLWFSTFLENLINDTKSRKVKFPANELQWQIRWLCPLLKLKAEDAEKILDEKIESEILKLMK